MTPERAREIAEGYGNDTAGITAAILASCAEERRAALTDAAKLADRYGRAGILRLRDRESGDGA